MIRNRVVSVVDLSEFEEVVRDEAKNGFRLAWQIPLMTCMVLVFVR
jgi:hypothetical protein